MIIHFIRHDELQTDDKMFSYLFCASGVTLFIPLCRPPEIREASLFNTTQLRSHAFLQAQQSRKPGEHTLY